MAPTRFTARGWLLLIGAAACLGLLCPGCRTKKGPPAGKTQKGIQAGPGRAEGVGARRQEYGEPVDGLSLAVDWESGAISGDRTKFEVTVHVKNVSGAPLWIPLRLLESEYFVKCVFFTESGEEVPPGTHTEVHPRQPRRADFTQLAPGQEMGGRPAVDLRGYKPGAFESGSVLVSVHVVQPLGVVGWDKPWRGELRSPRHKVLVVPPSLDTGGLG